MAIRPATLLDRKALVDMALLEAARYPALKPDREKIVQLATDAISSAKHFCMVAANEQGVYGALVGLTGDNLWAQRQFCSIVLWVSAIPGDGARLLRAFRDWVRSRPALRVAGFLPDTELDPRIGTLAERVGFQRHGGAYLLYTRGHIHGTV